MASKSSPRSSASAASIPTFSTPSLPPLSEITGETNVRGVWRDAWPVAVCSLVLVCSTTPRSSSGRRLVAHDRSDDRSCRGHSQADRRGERPGVADPRDRARVPRRDGAAHGRDRTPSVCVAARTDHSRVDRRGGDLRHRRARDRAGVLCARAADHAHRVAVHADVRRPLVRDHCRSRFDAGLSRPHRACVAPRRHR